MRFVLLTEAAKAGPKAVLSLEKEKVNHLRRVLRLDWNEHLNVLDGSGRLFDGVLEESEGGAHVRLQSLVRTEAAPLPMELVIGLPKNTTMDWLVEKAVECGVTAIRPVVTSRSVVKVDYNENLKYARRWQAIIDGAVEQSERFWRPEIVAPMSWEKFIAEKSSNLKTFAFLSELRQESQSDQKMVSYTWARLNEVSREPVRILIGPEGGFSDAEREQMAACAFEPVSLGKIVLRVETAVITALSLTRMSRLIS